MKDHASAGARGRDDARGWVVIRRKAVNDDQGGFPSDPALDALRTRFANGDIDEIEFESLRSVLQRH